MTHSDWSEAASADIATIDGETSWMEPAVRARTMGLWNILVYGERVGTVLWRIDHEPGGKALVIVAAAGRHPSGDLATAVMPVLKDIARVLGCDHVRFHTFRPGLVVKMIDQGFEPVEFVMRSAA